MYAIRSYYAYTTTVDANTTGAARFAILASPDVVSKVKENKINALSVFANGRNINIMGKVAAGSTVTIYDMAGRIAVIARLANENTNTVNGSALKAGVYMVKVQGNESVAKVILK